MSEEQLFRREVAGTDYPVVVTAYTHEGTLRYTYVTVEAGSVDNHGDIAAAEVAPGTYPAFRRDLLAALDTAARAAGVVEPAGWPAPHSPDSLCTCQSGAGVAKRCEYRLVADVVIDRFNPADDDAAESWVIEQAVTRAAAYIESLPCACETEPANDIGDPCARCAALGRINDEPMVR